MFFGTPLNIAIIHDSWMKRASFQNSEKLTLKKHRQTKQYHQVNNQSAERHYMQFSVIGAKKVFQIALSGFGWAEDLPPLAQTWLNQKSEEIQRVFFSFGLNTLKEFYNEDIENREEDDVVNFLIQSFNKSIHLLKQRFPVATLFFLGTGSLKRKGSETDMHWIEMWHSIRNKVMKKICIQSSANVPVPFHFVDLFNQIDDSGFKDDELHLSDDAMAKCLLFVDEIIESSIV